MSSSSTEHEALMDSHKKRIVYYRVSLACLNDQKQAVYEETTGVKHVSLTKNASHMAMKMNPAKVR